MSAFGPKRTFLVAPHMSAFGGKADIAPASERWTWVPGTTEIWPHSVPETDEPLGCLEEECLKSSSEVMIVESKTKTFDVGQCLNVTVSRRSTLGWWIPKK
jgi:hypothetical protein